MRDRAVDGLRGWAAFNVLICHYIAAFWPLLLTKNYDGIAMPAAEHDTLSRVLSFPLVTLAFNGAFAVMIFFVLSGYVLAAPSTQGDTRKLTARLWGRIPRLGIPIAVASLIAYAIFASGWHPNIEAGIESRSAWFQTFWDARLDASDALASIIQDGLFLGDITLIAPLWSLRVELIGSFVVLAVGVAAPRSREAICYFAAGYVVFAIMREGWTWYVAFLAGALINFMPRRRGNVELGVVVAGALYFGAFQEWSRLYAGLPGPDFISTIHTKDFYNLLGAILLVAAVRSGFANAFLNSRVSEFLGRISFSLYLLHFPILCSLGATLYLWADGVIWLQLLGAAVTMGATIAVSIVFASTIDAWSLRVSRKFGAWFVNSGVTSSDKPPRAESDPSPDRTDPAHPSAATSCSVTVDNIAAAR